MNEYIKKSEAVDVIVKYPYDIAGKTATAIKMIEDLPSADVVPRSTIEEIFALIWDAFQSTYYDSEFEEKFDKIEKKYIGDDMSRYIDADKLWNDRPQVTPEKSMDYKAGFSECMWAFSKLIREQIDNSTADVVPKSEVESIITLNSQLEAQVFEQRKEIERLKKYNTDVAFKHYNDGKAEVASEIFAEIERIILDNTYPDFNREHKPVNIWKAKDGYDALDELKKKYTE